MIWVVANSLTWVEERAPKAAAERPAIWVVVTPLSWAALSAPIAVAPMAEKLVALSAPTERP